MSSNFYGRPIDRNSATPLMEQAYRIIRSEISSGRWQIGERLPTYGEMEVMSGLSRSSLQSALGRLEMEGYVKRIPQRGNFVKATHVPGHTKGKVLVVTSEGVFPGHQPMTTNTQAFGLWSLAVFKGYATNYGFELKFLEVSSGCTASYALPDEGISGIISMVEPKCLKQIDLPENIPVAYLGLASPTVTPSLTADPFQAITKLTELLIEAGHSDILMLPSSTNNEYFRQQCFEGYCKTMTTAGLNPNTKAFSLACQWPRIDFLHLKAFLSSYSQSTALICQDILIASKVVEVADCYNICIPDELSIVCHQSGALRFGEAEKFTGITYEYDDIAEACFDIIEHTLAARHLHKSILLFHPQVVNGMSVAQPSPYAKKFDERE